MFSPFDATGVLAPDTYDALVSAPWSSARMLEGTRSVVVLGNGGSTFVRDFLDTPHTGANPLDTYTVAQAQRIIGDLRQAGFDGAAAYYWEQRSGTYADFQRLAVAAGMGAPSKLGLMVHPVFGPWIALRALLYTDKELPPTPARDDFDPCTGCPAPCERACPVSAVGFPFQIAACGVRRQQAPCTQWCDARRACVIGPEHTYEPAVQAFHSRAALKKPDPS